MKNKNKKKIKNKKIQKKQKSKKIQKNKKQKKFKNKKIQKNKNQKNSKKMKNKIYIYFTLTWSPSILGRQLQHRVIFLL